MLISCEQVPSSWVPTLSSVNCRSVSCCFCQQLSAAPLSSFHTRLTSLHGSIFCSSMQASLYAAVVDLVLLVCNTLWWAWSLLLIRVCSSWSLGFEPVLVFSVWLANICLGCVVYDLLQSCPFLVWY